MPDEKNCFLKVEKVESELNIYLVQLNNGGVPEWFKGTVLKTVVLERVP